MKDHLQALTRLLKTALEGASAGGLIAQLNPVYADLFELNQKPQANVDANATDRAVKALHARSYHLRKQIALRVQDWTAKENDLRTKGELNTPAQWEGFVREVMKTTLTYRTEL